jgi:hypothetical protein
VFEDVNGYQPLTPHLVFLGLTSYSLSNCHSRIRPLGMMSSEFKEFVESLKRDLRREGLDPDDIDVRLKGSSANFYSGLHKLMPTDRDMLRAAFRVSRGEPEEAELDEIEELIDAVWPQDNRPHRRPFDSMQRLRVDRHPSDYDIQISSNKIVERAREHLRSQEKSDDDTELFSQTYDFIKKEIVHVVCPVLSQWAVLQSEHLKRGVTLAVFTSKGPPNKVAEIGELSSHFRDTDWKLLSEKKKDSVTK